MFCLGRLGWPIKKLYNMDRNERLATEALIDTIIEFENEQMNNTTT